MRQDLVAGGPLARGPLWLSDKFRVTAVAGEGPPGDTANTVPLNMGTSVRFRISFYSKRMR